MTAFVYELLWIAQHYNLLLYTTLSEYFIFLLFLINAQIADKLIVVKIKNFFYHCMLVSIQMHQTLGNYLLCPLFKQLSYRVYEMAIILDQIKIEFLLNDRRKSENYFA